MSFEGVAGHLDGRAGALAFWWWGPGVGWFRETQTTIPERVLLVDMAFDVVSEPELSLPGFRARKSVKCDSSALKKPYCSQPKNSHHSRGVLFSLPFPSPNACK